MNIFELEDMMQEKYDAVHYRILTDGVYAFDTRHGQRFIVHRTAEGVVVYGFVERLDG